MFLLAVLLILGINAAMMHSDDDAAMMHSDDDAVIEKKRKTETWVGPTRGFHKCVCLLICVTATIARDAVAVNSIYIIL